jgi:RNA recognition motif-containing protein
MESAKLAATNIDRKDLGGRWIKCNLASDRTNNMSSNNKKPYRQSDNKNIDNSNCKTVFVGNLSFNTTEQSVND